ncbi:MAG: succinate dehydrogenase cytochrome b subunit [Vicingaceae bacterium]
MSMTSVARKFLMALTGLFLITFLILHLSINLLTLSDDPALFNQASHFMATNPVIQSMQYILALGFILHIGMGIWLNIQNNTARPIKYAKNNAGANSSAASRSMIYTGMLVMVFLLIHLYNYWYQIKFVGVDDDYLLVTELFKQPLYTGIYVVAFVLLGIHLNHGFQSAFQSLGANHRSYTSWIKNFGTLYSAITALGFSAIAIYHFINSI